MSTTFDARDGDAPTPASPNVALADEESLRRVFLSEFSALTDEARADLGTEARALAPKVVEGSFVRAWDARARFRTPEEVHQFLVEDVHHAAARALSRRASAHRLAGGGHADAHAMQDESPEEAWSHIMHALHGEAHSPQALANAAAHSRHEAAEHIKVTSKGTPIWIPLLMGATVVAVLLGLATYMTHLSTNERFARALNAPDAKPIAAASAQIGVVTLDDGSKVRLTPESRIIVPKLFGPELRVVRLEGTAEFTVAPGVPKPFTVNARNINVVATGTSFTVKASPGDTAITVVVAEGTVQVGHRGEDMHDVAAGSAVVAEGSSVRPATAAERDEADAWRAGMLVVNDKPLGQVLPMFKRWYGLAVLVPQPALLERKVTFRASLDSTRQAIRGIEESTGLQFGYIGQNMAFHEPEAKAAAKPAAKGGKKK
jgi:ferric-dicitrate binding protein FerR (iron transport regulator)